MLHCPKKPKSPAFSGAVRRTAAAAPPGHVRTVSTAALRCKATSSCKPSASHLARWLGPRKVAILPTAYIVGTEVQNTVPPLEELTLSEPAVDLRACRSSHGLFWCCRPGPPAPPSPPTTGPFRDTPHGLMVSIWECT